ncbi:hypothetical protein L1987_06001 [Smallanthus sonchifolius]|uniref:Uncharacterized protein n=1 Tax=Smallanthus sonchifolius TaxID=185202 RepID=A0ACB9JXB1_9ASTR|nr:hypothetical protein L1987_06001 [Smallanthus sonchifolius]
MPSGAKKRKAAKKKKVNPHQGESDGGELSSPTSPHPSVEVEKKEDNSSENKCKDAIEEQSHIEIEKGSKSKSSNGSGSSSSGSSDDESRVVEKNVVVVESAPNESVPAVESVEKVSPAVESVEKVSPIVDSVKPMDSLLEEVSQVFDEIKNEKKKDLVVEEQAVVVCATAIKDDCTTSSVVAESVLKENEVEKLISLDEKASSISNDYVSSSTPPENLISEVNGADRANESDTIEHSNRQAPAASTAVAVQPSTTWKSCCGLFELFSGSER